MDKAAADTAEDLPATAVHPDNLPAATARPVNPGDMDLPVSPADMDLLVNRVGTTRRNNSKGTARKVTVRNTAHNSGRLRKKETAA